MGLLPTHVSKLLFGLTGLLASPKTEKSIIIVHQKGSYECAVCSKMVLQSSFKSKGIHVTVLSNQDTTKKKQYFVTGIEKKRSISDAFSENLY